MWKANKLIKVLLWVLAAISVALCIYVFYACSGLNPSDPAEKEAMMSAIDPIFRWSYILLFLTIAVTVLLPLPELIKNPKSALGMLGGIGALGIVILISYLQANGDQLPFTPGHAPVSSETIIFADVNMMSSYIMLGATIVTVVVAEVLEVLKMR